MKIVTFFRPGERRRAQRVRALLPAQLTALGRSQPVDCTVRDLSRTGARVHVGPHTPPDETVSLEIQPYGVRTHARVVWRKGEYLGVRFIETQQPTATPAIVEL